MSELDPRTASGTTWSVLVRPPSDAAREVLRPILTELNPHLGPAELDSILKASEVTIARGLSATNANRIMLRLHEAGFSSQKRPEPAGQESLPPRPLTIGGPIGNETVNGYIRANVPDSERLIATLLGLGEKTSIGALFGQKAGAALGGEYLVVTNRKVIAIKSGVSSLATGSLGGLKTKTYLLDTITSVDVNRGLVFGEIEILTAGMVEKATGGFFAGAARDSVIQFEKKHFEEVSRLAATIREMAIQARQANSAVLTVASDIPDQIRKLAELHAKGILTEEEFKAKKQSLLDRL